MGSITRSLGNNITTGGVILPAGITNSSVSAVTSFANASAGTLVLLSTQTASSSATISFTTGLNSTYDSYEFHFINIKPATDRVDFQFNASTDGGTNYNVTKTSNVFYSAHNETDTVTSLSYDTNIHLNASTAFQTINTNQGNASDECCTGVLQLFNLSSTSYVKHFIFIGNHYANDDYMVEDFCAGYLNTTSAINAIQFKMSSGNIADGIFKLYGVKKS